MKVKLRIEGLAALYRIFKKKKKLDVEFSGTTLRELVETLTKKYGSGVKKNLLDATGEIDMELRVAINLGKTIDYGKRMDTVLHDGDMLHLMTVG